MDPETNPQSTDPEAIPGSGQDVPSTPAPSGEALTLPEINKIVGREFTSKADAVKHLDSLKSLVGDQSILDLKKKAEQFDTLNPRYNALVQAYATENKIPVSDAIKDIENYLEKTTPATPDNSQSDLAKKVAVLEKERLQDKFLAKHPEAKELIDVIEAVANSKGISYEQALLDSPLAKLVPRTGEATTEPNRKIGTNSQEIQALTEEVKKGNAPFERKQAFVRELGLAK